MATTAEFPKKPQKPGSLSHTILAKGEKVIVSKQVFTDFASI